MLELKIYLQGAHEDSIDTEKKIRLRTVSTSCCYFPHFIIIIFVTDFKGRPKLFKLKLSALLYKIYTKQVEKHHSVLPIDVYLRQC